MLNIKTPESRLMEKIEEMISENVLEDVLNVVYINSIVVNSKGFPVGFKSLGMDVRVELLGK
jgi:hypothetical protein